MRLPPPGRTYRRALLLYGHPRKPLVAPHELDAPRSGWPAEPFRSPQSGDTTGPVHKWGTGKAPLGAQGASKPLPKPIPPLEESRIPSCRRSQLEAG
mgnify:CR=1 FL=1